MTSRKKKVALLSAGVALAGTPLGMSPLAAAPIDSEPVGDAAKNPEFTERDVAISSAQNDLHEFVATASTQYPEAFGGIYTAEDGATIVRVVESAASSVELKQRISRALDRVSLETQGRYPYRFEAADRPQSELEAVVNVISEDMLNGGDFLQAGVAGVGLDTRGSVGVTLGPDADEGLLDRLLTERFGDVPVEVSMTTGESKKSASRYDDNPPFNGGNSIAGFVGSFAQSWCTTGFGAHNSAGTRFQITAGHCGDWEWFNTDYGSPDTDTKLGVTSQLIFTNGGIDSQLIASNSSQFFWKGPNGGQRKTVHFAGSAWTGLPVCMEGAGTAAFGFEHCGAVGLINNTVYYTNDGWITTGLFGIVGAPYRTIEGDSGGPVVSHSDTSGWGAYGTIDGWTEHEVNGVPVYTNHATHIQVPLYVWGLTLNTPSTP